MGSQWTWSFAGKLLAARWVLFAIGLILFGLAYPSAQRIRFERSIASMFPADDPAYLAYRELQEQFGGNAVVMLVYQDSELTADAGVERNRIMTERVAAIPGIKGVLSPSVLNSAISKLQPLSILNRAPTLFRKGNKIAEGLDELFAGYTHSQDHSHASVVAILEPGYAPQTIEKLKEITSTLRNSRPTSSVGSSLNALTSSQAVATNQAVLVGEPVLVHDGFDLIEKDGAKLATTTVILLSVVVFLSLLDLRFVAMSTLLILWSTVVTQACMVFIGSNLSLVSTILTAIITVIAVTAVLHMGVRFRNSKNRGHDQKQAATESIAILLMPILWTCMTDAAGFAALSASQILPIREFGIMIAISAIAVCVAILLFSPALLMLPSIRIHHQLDKLQLRFSRVLRRRCISIADASIRSPRKCLAVASIMAAIAVIGMGRTETETSFLNNFAPDSEVVSAYQEVETQFGGAGVWDIILDAPAELNTSYLDQVRLLEEDLRTITINGEGLTKVLSLADADQVASRSAVSALLSPSSRLSAMSVVMPVFFDALLSEPNGEQRKLRIMLRSREQLDTKTKTALIEEVKKLVHQHVTSQAWIDVTKAPGKVTSKAETNVDKKAQTEDSTESLASEANQTESSINDPAQAANSGQVTGYYVIMADLINQLVQDQWRCFGTSSILILLLLWVATGSIRLALVALVPNILPVFLVLSLVGFTGGKINMGAAMIASVSVGLSIDGSVHFLAGYQRARRRKHKAQTSSRHAAGRTGVPILLATAALMVGFGVMSTSDFAPTATFGILVASTLAIGTVVNLTLLPAFVVWATPELSEGS